MLWPFASYWLERRGRETKSFEHGAEEFEDIPLARPWPAPLLAIGGIGALVFGADMLVDGAVINARDFGVATMGWKVTSEVLRRRHDRIDARYADFARRMRSGS